MDSTSELRQIVAGFFQIDADRVTSDLDLRAQLNGSLARGQLDASIRRRLKITCPAVYTASTYGELESAAFGLPFTHEQSATASFQNNTKPAAKPHDGVGFLAMPTTDGIQCGVDIESPEDLPVETDYWESDFYRSHFTSAEIAYCIAQRDSRQHFAARWCAKEALKKCDSDYLGIEMSRIEVSHDAAGRPGLLLISDEGAKPIPVAVSLAHTKSMAIAVVVRAIHVTPIDVAQTKDSPGKPADLSEPSYSIGPKKSWLRRLFGI
jgi:phosphopantetheine--protein transferase-like protein